MIYPDLIFFKDFILLIYIIIIIYILGALLPVLTGTVAGGIFLISIGIGLGASGIYIITQHWKKEQKKKEEPPHED